MHSGCSTVYNYDVGFDGDPGMDPVIIVE